MVLLQQTWRNMFGFTPDIQRNCSLCTPEEWEVLSLLWSNHYFTSTRVFLCLSLQFILIFVCTLWLSVKHTLSPDVFPGGSCRLLHSKYNPALIFHRCVFLLQLYLGVPCCFSPFVWTDHVPRAHRPENAPLLCLSFPIFSLKCFPPEGTILLSLLYTLGLVLVWCNCFVLRHFTL